MSQYLNKDQAPTSICKKIIKFNYLIRIIPLFNLSFHFFIQLISSIYTNVFTINSGLKINAWLPSLFIYIFLFITFFYMLYKCIHNWRNPQYSNLARSIIKKLNNQNEHFESTNAIKLFDDIDNDIYFNGNNFGNLHIGKEWILGKIGMINYSAVKLENIIYFFPYEKYRYGNNYSRTFYFIYTMDKFFKETVFLVNSKSQLTSSIHFLKSVIPFAKYGNMDNYYNLKHKSSEEKELYLINYKTSLLSKIKDDKNKIKAKEAIDKQNFIIEGSYIVPTSIITNTLLRNYIKNLNINNYLKLKPISPIEINSAEKNIGLICQKTSEDIFDIVTITSINNKTTYYKTSSDINKTISIFESYYSYKKLPSIVDWIETENYNLNFDKKTNDTLTINSEKLLKL